MSESRKLGEQERMLHYACDACGMMPMQVLHIRGRLDAALVERALRWLQSQHPVLRAHIRYGGLVFRRLPPFVYRQPYFDTEGTTPIPFRVVDRPWQDVLSEEMRKPIRRGRHPRMRVTLIHDQRDEELNHIILCADHATFDAQAAHLASRHLLEYLADPRTMEARPPAGTHLPPPLEEGMPTKPDTGSRHYMPAVRLPRHPVRGEGWGTRIVSRLLDKPATEALKEAARANRATMHGAICAAFFLAMRDRYGIAEMTCLASIDMRRLCKPPLPAETYGCYIDVLRTHHVVGSDFWALARDVSFKLISTLAKERETASVLKLPEWGVYAAEAWPTLTHRRRLDGLGITTAGDSGLRAAYGSYTLEGVTMAMPIHLVGPSLLVIGAERMGALDLSVNYAADSFPASEAEAMTDFALAALAAAGVVAAG